MRRIAAISLALALAAPAVVGASTMVLDHQGSLYRLVAVEDQLIVEINEDAQATRLAIPQTTGMTATNLNLAVDEANGVVIAVWQEVVDEHLSRIQLATYRAGTWWGPVAVAGEEWITAVHPEIYLHRARSTVIDEDGAPTEIGTSILHLAWWADLAGENGGYAVHQAIELSPEGVPLLEGSTPTPLVDLWPWGVACNIEDRTRTLAHPRLFLDPETGDPHLLVASLADCLFAVFRLHPELQDDEDLTTHRRRHVVILGRTRDIAIAPALRLDDARIEVGHGMSVVVHWDEGDEVRYVTMNESGWSTVKSLAVGPDLGHEQAVTLIRRLTH